MYGSSGHTGAALHEKRWWRLPGWCREKVTPADSCRRLVGGGILIPATGELLRTPWRVRFSGGHVYIYRVDESGIPCLQ